MSNWDGPGGVGGGFVTFKSFKTVQAETVRPTTKAKGPYSRTIIIMFEYLMQQTPPSIKSSDTDVLLLQL